MRSAGSAATACARVRGCCTPAIEAFALERVPPQIDEVNPDVLPISGGTEVTYVGQGFSPVLAPRLGGIPVFNYEVLGPNLPE